MKMTNPQKLAGVSLFVVLVFTGSCESPKRLVAAFGGVLLDCPNGITVEFSLMAHNSLTGEGWDIPPSEAPDPYGWLILKSGSSVFRESIAPRFDRYRFVGKFYRHKKVQVRRGDTLTVVLRDKDLQFDDFIIDHTFVVDSLNLSNGNLKEVTLACREGE